MKYETCEYLPQLSGLKACALWLIILHHRQIHIWTLNPASRCVELLFVISGFLAIYRYVPHSENTFAETVRYIKQRLIPIIPLYYGTLLYFLIVSKPHVKEVLLSLFFLQAWSPKPEIYFSLNGPAWFISALLFCLLFVPLLAKYLSKLRKKKVSSFIITVLIVCAARYVLEIYSDVINPGLMSVHTSPLIRLFDFMLGGIAASVFLNYRKRNSKQYGLLFSGIELILAVSVILVDGTLGMKIPRTVYVLYFSIIVFFFAFGSGIISYILSIKLFRCLSKIQLSSYMLHTMVGSICAISLFRLIPTNETVEACIVFGGIISTSAIYELYIRRSIEKRIKNTLKIN